MSWDLNVSKGTDWGTFDTGTNQYQVGNFVGEAEVTYYIMFKHRKMMYRNA